MMDDNHDAHGHQVPSAAFRQHLRRKLTSEVRQPELEVSNNGDACEFDGRPNGDVDRIWALQAVPYATSPYRGRHTDPPLTEAGTPIHLGSRALDVLVALLERRGELVSKEELMAKVWPNTCGVPTNIAVPPAGSFPGIYVIAANPSVKEANRLRSGAMRS